MLEELSRSDVEAVGFAGDIRREGDVASVVNGAVQAMGGLDVLYNNAGVYWAGRDAPVDRLERDVWDEVISINTTSAFLFAKHSLPHFLRAGSGVLLNVASVAAYAGDPACHAYAASKAALIGLTKSIAQCYGSRGVRANVICPGFIDTPMVDWLTLDEDALSRIVAATALRRVGSADEVAAVAAFLASSEASFMTSSVVTVHGGLVK